MSETTPPIPKSGGSGPFILAAIVMLLLMGGLIFWKMKGSPETSKVEAPKPSAALDQPVLDEAPPPPPPIASADSSAKPDETKPGTKKITGGGGSCGPCSLDPTPSVVSALHAKGAQARSCYEHALRQNAMLAGRMSITVTINQSGQVCSATVGSNGLGDPAVANCVVQMMRSGSFPSPGNGCVQVAVPLNFTPKT